MVKLTMLVTRETALRGNATMWRKRAMVIAVMAWVATGAAARPDVAHPYATTIARDEWGIPHVHGHSDADAVYGMIYAQAEDDFPRIETNYLTNLGRLAEAEGDRAVWSDLRQRLFIDPVTLRADYAKSPPWLQALMTAWADALNIYLADHPDVHPRVLTHFEPWMALCFSEGSIGGDIERVPLGPLEAFYGGRPVATAADLSFREPRGSNGIAIAPKLTRDGHALLLINPHTSFFFRAEAQVTSDAGLNAYGAATWGQFFIYQGFNAHAGWMHTTSGVDTTDEFVETVGGGENHRAVCVQDGSRCVEPIARVIVVRIRQADGSLRERSFDTFTTRHGPVVGAASPGRWLSAALMNTPVTALEQSFLRTKANSRADFLAVASRRANSTNNTLFADDAGEISLLVPQFVPVRAAKFDYTQPVDGSDPASAWHGLHALTDLPQVNDPVSGFVYNSNDAPWRAAGEATLTATAFPRYFDQAGANPRGDHALRVLNAERAFTPEKLIAAAYDPYLPAFARLLPGLIAAHDRAPLAARAGPVALLRAWDNRWRTGSTATSLAVFWGEALWATAAVPAKAAGLSVWDYMATRSSDAERLAALDAATTRLTTDFGDWRVPWGEINRFQRNDGQISQTFDDAKPSTAVPFTSAQWGSLASFGAKRYPGTKRYYGTSGNSFVAVVEFGPQVRAWAVTAGGESGDPASPHFADQVDHYAAGALRPVRFIPADVAAHAVCTYRPGAPCTPQPVP